MTYWGSLSNCVKAKYHVFSHLEPFSPTRRCTAKLFLIGQSWKRWGAEAFPLVALKFNTSDITRWAWLLSQSGSPSTPPQCVNKLCLRRISPRATLLYSHSWKRTAGEPKDSSSVLMKHCEWNNWARSGTYFFIKTPLKDCLLWILLELHF